MISYSRKLNKFFAFVVAGLSVGAIILASNVLADTAQIGGEINGYKCVTSENRWKIENGNVATLPVGYGITSVFVKSATDCIQVYPTNNASSCYSILIDGQTITVTRLVESNDCQGISHLEGTYSIVATPTATASASCKPTPTCHPTRTPRPTITPTPTATPTSSSQPTPTETSQDEPTVTPTITATSSGDVCANIEGIQTSLPEGYHFDNDKVNCLTFELGGAPTPPSAIGGGEVLGATSMAGTGIVEENIFYSLFTLGALLSSLGIMKNASSKIKN